MTKPTNLLRHVFSIVKKRTVSFYCALLAVNLLPYSTNHTSLLPLLTSLCKAMWNSLTSGVGMFAAKQKMNSMFGGGEQVDTDKSNKMRQELADKRKERDGAGGPAKANKGKLSQMWAENKAKNQS